MSKATPQLVAKGNAEYEAFISSKKHRVPSVGFDVEESALHSILFPFQKAIVRWALKKGRGALFEACGTGKTLQQISWADLVYKHTGQPCLIVAPLAVSHQTADIEAPKMGLFIKQCRSHEDVINGLNITNYEMLHHFDPSAFGSIVIDESGILKGLDSKTRKQLNEFAKTIYYRLACTATPSPNDLIEIINHAEFLGIMTEKEIKAKYFTLDGNNTNKWRLRGHAEEDFWEFLAQWCVAIEKPSDIGFSDEGYELPPLHRHEVMIESPVPAGHLFHPTTQTLEQRRQARRDTLPEKIKRIAEHVNNSTETFAIWCDLNIEGDALEKAIPDAVQITGSDSIEKKRKALEGFIDGKIRVLISKPEIAGFGLNLQHCNHTIFIGLSDSFEKLFQAIRRFWRFGQKRDVHMWVYTSDAEGATMMNIRRKEAQMRTLMENLVKHVNVYSDLRTERQEVEIKTETTTGKGWTMNLGDTTERLDELEENSVGLILTSPPFPLMYCYHNSQADVGNCANLETLVKQFSFMMPKMLRALKPGRSCILHITQQVAFKGTDDYCGLKDFRGELIKAMSNTGFEYYGEWVVDKNPQAVRDGTLVLTPTGWVRVQEIQIGESVIGSDGKPTKVIQTYSHDDRPMYHITFTDGAQIDCDAQHLWTVRTEGMRYTSGEWQTLSTQKLAQGWVSPTGRLQYEIPRVSAAVEFKKGEQLPVEPYLLGVFLGNGNLTCRDSVSACIRHETAESLILPQRHQIRMQNGSENADNSVAVYFFTTQDKKNNLILNGLKALKLHGKRAWEKSIPQEYLYASVEDRKSLLQGLLDTDGTIKKNNAIKYTTTSVDLAMDIQFLVASLGGLTIVKVENEPKYTHKGEQRIGRPQYVISVQLEGDWCPFRLSNKVARWTPRQRMIRRKIADIEMVDSSSATCLEVENEDGLFVIENFVLTHNCKAVRTKDAGLQFKSLATDSARMHAAMPDYLLQFRKPGQNFEPIRAGISEKYKNPNGWITQDEWIEWAAPVWYRHLEPSDPVTLHQHDYPSLSAEAFQYRGTNDSPKALNGIQETDVLNAAIARDAKDERHPCPLQLGVCERLIKLLSNPDDLIVDTFGGIGSVGYMAVKLGRRAWLCDLKESYYRTAIKNLQLAERSLEAEQPALLAMMMGGSEQ